MRIEDVRLDQEVTMRNRPDVVGRVIGISTANEKPVMVAWRVRHSAEDLELREVSNAAQEQVQRSDDGC